MKWLGTKVIQLDTVKVPSGFAKRKKEPHVKELAKSISRGGVISLPVVRAKPRELVVGGDRLAALMILGITRHEVRLVEGSDAELRTLTLEENLRRRRNDDYDAMTRELVQLTGEQIEEKRAEEIVELSVNVTANAEPEARKPGRPKTAKGEAREAVAAATGRTPEAVRQAEKRARAEEKEKAKEEAANPHQWPEGIPKAPPVDVFGLETNVVSNVEEAFSKVRIVQSVLDEAGRLVAKAMSRLTSELRGDGSGGGIMEGAWARTHQALHDAADAIRRARPDSLCPMCKGQPQRTRECSFCLETAFVSRSMLEGIAGQLLDRGADAKVPDGRGGFVLVTTAGAPPAKRQPAKGARRLRVEDDEGNDITAPSDPSDLGF